MAREALHKIKRGKEVVYFRGKSLANAGIVQLALEARDLFDQGRVHLFQRRIGLPGPSITAVGVVERNKWSGDGFEYIAVGI